MRDAVFIRRAQGSRGCHKAWFRSVDKALTWGFTWCTLRSRGTIRTS